MALQAAYEQFLAAPNTSFLAPDASIHYITTLVTFNGASAIIKHLNGQVHELKKKEEKFLDVVEGANALAVEIHTTIEFLTGGGSYLPGLDDNFLADRTVTLPIIHIVTFDANGKIQQIRQAWDQGSLLKLIDVIGKTGRNWPIRDGKDQIKLIANSVKSSGKLAESAPSNDAQGKINRSRENSNNVTRDPHASLSLFAPREKNIAEALPNVVAPRASAKPPPRDYHDLFVGYESPTSPTKAAAPPRDESPSRADLPIKAGAGRNYAPSRLFDRDEVPEESPDKIHGTDKFYQPNPKRYTHFDITDTNDEPEVAARPEKPVRAKQHDSQWNFDDFMTPQKVVPSKVLRTNDVRHWGNSDDEVTDSPIKMKKVDKPRPSAETHFEFEDDGTPDGPRIIGRPRGAGQNNGLGLYKNNLYDEENGGAAPGIVEKPIRPISNVPDRNKTFGSQFSMTDAPSPTTATAPPIPLPADNARAKAVKMMDANWSSYDQSPKQKENVAPVKQEEKRGNGKVLVEATNNMSARNDKHVGILTDGDGMGGKKGRGRQWGFGDESDGEEDDGGRNKPGKYRTGKTGVAKQGTGGDFWDF